MPRRQIVFETGRYYHIYNRGHNRQAIFFNRDNYIHFLRLINKYLIETNSADIIAYCLMPNHYHLLVYLRADHFSKSMQRLSVSYVKAFNKSYQRVGTLFQRRFQAILVDRDEYLFQLTRYIHLNPVKAKLVDKAEDWEFSSYREYVDLRPGSLPKCEEVRSHFNSANNYRRFVERSIQTASIQHLMFDE
ncbi:transposase [Lyngbya sp. CCY1209]|jgi:REP element-mobilizing transposase RayT|uniref:REP-associated tyrosine transposase n=1 Tax=Lyngbya sp. CCY1209 TaxID=2886103 RepID=UPI002D204660|nr:transposase [Lyngbya sp. CCY1209]MEB3881939.1 transposase [Lyngbya sp. CCY1209]